MKRRCIKKGCGRAVKSSGVKAMPRADGGNPNSIDQADLYCAGCFALCAVGPMGCVLRVVD